MNYHDDANLTFFPDNLANCHIFKKFKISSKIMELVSASPMYISHFNTSSEQHIYENVKTCICVYEFFLIIISYLLSVTGK